MVQERENLIVLILLILLAISVFTSLMHARWQSKQQIPSGPGYRRRARERVFHRERYSTQTRHWVIEWLSNLLGGLAPEFAGALILALAAIWLINPAEQLQSQDELVHLAGSQHNAVALNAVEELRARRWLPHALANSDLSNSDLRLVILDGINLENTVFVRANLQNASFNGTNLSSANFSGSDLRGTNFSNSNLQNAIFRDADLQNAVFINAQLMGADFAGTNLHNIDLSGTSLQQVIFAGANLQTVFLRTQNRSGELVLSDDGDDFVYFLVDNYTSTEDFRISFQLTDFRYNAIQTILNEGGWRFPVPPPLPTATAWAGLLIDECKSDMLFSFNRSLPRVSMSASNLEQANIQGSDWRNFDLIEVNLINSTLRDIRLSGSNLQKSLLIGTNLDESALDLVDFSDSILIGASLMDSESCLSNFENVDLALADLRGANLFGSNLRGAILGEREAISSEGLDTTAKFDENTILPNGDRWSPDTDMQIFTNSQHSKFWDACSQSFAYIFNWCE